MLIPLRTHHTLECGENFYSANHTPKTIGHKFSYSVWNLLLRDFYDDRSSYFMYNHIGRVYDVHVYIELRTQLLRMLKMYNT